jgi:ATP-dependent Clp protease ATP-binding subunit ClpB
MRFDKLTLKAQDALQNGQAIASQQQHPAVDTEHLLLGLLQQDGGIAAPLLEKIDVDPAAVTQDIQDALGRMPKVSGGAAYGSQMTSRLQQSFNVAFSEAEKLGDSFVSTEHLALAIVHESRQDAGRHRRAAWRAKSQRSQRRREVSSP